MISWIDALSMLAGTLMGGATTFVFTRRLDQKRMPLALEQAYRQKTVDGLAHFMSQASAVAQSVADITAQLVESAGVPAKAVESLDFHARNYIDALNVHRVYLEPLIPFGTTHDVTGFDYLRSLKFYLDRLDQPAPRPSEPQFETTTDVCIYLGGLFRERYLRLGAHVSELIAVIISSNTTNLVSIMGRSEAVRAPLRAVLTDLEVAEASTLPRDPKDHLWRI